MNINQSNYVTKTYAPVAAAMNGYDSQPALVTTRFSNLHRCMGSNAQKGNTIPCIVLNLGQDGHLALRVQKFKFCTQQGAQMMSSTYVLCCHLLYVNMT